MIERIEDLVEDYCSMTSGSIPNESTLDKIVKVISYLIDNDYEDIDILKTLISLEEMDCSKISYEGIETILKPNTFYYHNILHITSKAPSFDPITMEETCHPFYLEMKIKFNIDNLLNYYYEKTLIPIGMRDKSKDTGSLKHLLNKYSKIEDVESVDIVLSLIDRAYQDKDNQIYNVFELERYMSEVYEYYSNMIPMANLSKTNKIVWR